MSYLRVLPWSSQPTWMKRRPSLCPTFSGRPTPPSCSSGATAWSATSGYRLVTPIKLLKALGTCQTSLLAFKKPLIRTVLHLRPFHTRQLIHDTTHTFVMYIFYCTARQWWFIRLFLGTFLASWEPGAFHFKKAILMEWAEWVRLG